MDLASYYRRGSLSLSGMAVDGAALVRDIYSDEAGTSGDPDDRVSVVVGLIVHADTQWEPVVVEFGRLVLNAVPRQYLADFALHAKDLFNKRKYPDWPRAGRYALLKQVLQLPVRFNIPFSVGIVKRGGAPRVLGNLEQYEQDHLMAFTLCMGGADSYLRGRCPAEAARIIAEDLPRMKVFLNRAFMWLRQNSLELDELPMGAPAMIKRSFKIRKIVDHPLYADRHASPILQIADACAFTFKRFFGGYSYGDVYANYLLGEDLVKQLANMPPGWVRYHSTFVRGPEAMRPPSGAPCFEIEGPLALGFS